MLKEPWLKEPFLTKVAILSDSLFAYGTMIKMIIWTSNITGNENMTLTVLDNARRYSTLLDAT
jgi:hypothetical protein